MQKLINNPDIFPDIFHNYFKEKKFIEEYAIKFRSEKIPIISIETGVFLEILCIAYKPKRIIEIGCGCGFSSYFLIKNLQKNSSYLGIDLNKQRLEKAGKFISSKFSYKNNVQFIAGNALKIIPELKNDFDFVFIDGAKFEYPEYFKLIGTKLSSKAIIVADNIFYKGNIFKNNVSKHNINSVNGINDFIALITEKRCFKTYFFNIGDGISLTEFKRINNVRKK